MKMSLAYRKAQENMAAGEISGEGFLGDDLRPLADIIAADESAMKKIGLDFDEVAARLRYLFQKGQAGLGEPITVDDRWIVRVSEARGVIPCPFEDGSEPKINIEVTRRENGSRLAYTALSIHLMEKHHFLEGEGAPFRIEPETIKIIFPEI